MIFLWKCAPSYHIINFSTFTKRLYCSILLRRIIFYPFEFLLFLYPYGVYSIVFALFSNILSCLSLLATSPSPITFVALFRSPVPFSLQIIPLYPSVFSYVLDLLLYPSIFFLWSIRSSLVSSGCFPLF